MRFGLHFGVLLDRPFLFKMGPYTKYLVYLQIACKFSYNFAHAERLYDGRGWGMGDLQSICQLTDVYRRQKKRGSICM